MTTTDSGWAWVVMVGCFVNLLMTISFIRAQALLLLVWIEYYSAPVALTTLAFGLSEIAESVTSLILPGILLPRFSIRFLTVSGAVITCGSILALAFTSDLYLLNFLFCILGASRGLILSPQQLLLGYYFRKRLAFANGFAHAGLSVATIGAPVLTQALLLKYGLRGTLMLLAALHLHSVPMSMLFRPFKDSESGNNSRADVSAIAETENISLIVSIDNADEPNKFSNNSPTRCSCNGSSELNKDDHRFGTDFEERQQIQTELKDKQRDTYCTISYECSIDPKLPVNRPFEFGTNKHIVSSLCGNNTLHSTQVIDLGDNHSDIHLMFNETALKRPSNETNSISSAEPNQNKIDMEHENVETLNSGPQFEELKINQTQDHKSNSGSKMSFRWVLTNPMALIIIVGGGLGVHTQGSAVFLAVLGKENGITEWILPWLLTLAGVCDIIGKVIFGVLVDNKILQPITLACMTQGLAGLTYQLTWFYQGEGLMFTMAAVSGFTAGNLHVMLTPMTVMTLGRSALAHVMAAYFLLSGLVTFLMQVVVGIIKDTTGSFRGGYNFIGALMLSTVVVFSLKLLCRNRVEGRRMKGREGFLNKS